MKTFGVLIVLVGLAAEAQDLGVESKIVSFTRATGFMFGEYSLIKGSDSECRFGDFSPVRESGYFNLSLGGEILASGIGVPNLVSEDTFAKCKTVESSSYTRGRSAKITARIQRTCDDLGLTVYDTVLTRTTVGFDYEYTRTRNKRVEQKFTCSLKRQ